MVAAGMSTTPLENDGEFGVECDMFDASLSQPINDLDSSAIPTPAGIWDWISATLVRMTSGL
jgi:hypothetical protein